MSSVSEGQGDGHALGPCPICGRPMLAGPSVDRHHFVPKSRGGRETGHVHRICHRKIHSLWTERELEQAWSNPETIRTHPAMRTFLAWLADKHPVFYVRTRDSRGRRGC